MEALWADAAISCPHRAIRANFEGSISQRRPVRPRNARIVEKRCFESRSELQGPARLNSTLLAINVAIGAKSALSRFRSDDSLGLAMLVMAR